MRLLRITFIIISVFVICSCSQTENNGIEKEINQPFISIDSAVFTERNINLYITDSLPFFNPTTNGQSIAVICEQLNVTKKDFNQIQFHIKMPNREDGIEGSFSKDQYIALRQLYFNKDLFPFYNLLLKLNWKSRHNYSSNKMTLIDRINMTFQSEIKKNFSKEFPGGSDWYGYNAFIIFNKYKEELSSGVSGDATKVLKSLKHNPNNYIKKEDLKQVLELVNRISN